MLFIADKNLDLFLSPASYIVRKSFQRLTQSLALSIYKHGLSKKQIMCLGMTKYRILSKTIKKNEIVMKIW
jgi:hypothetical protein